MPNASINATVEELAKYGVTYNVSHRRFDWSEICGDTSCSQCYIGIKKEPKKVAEEKEIKESLSTEKKETLNIAKSEETNVGRTTARDSMLRK